MTAKEILLKVKALFDAPVIVPPVVPAAAADPVVPTPTVYKLKDGGEISVTISGTELSAGDLVTIAGVPAPAGDYELEDGTKLTCDAMGMITLIVSAPPTTQPDFVAPPVKTLEERIAAIEEALLKLSAPAIPTGLATEIQLQAAEQKIIKQDEKIKLVLELAEKLIEEPSADPVTLTGKDKQRFEKINAKDERLRKMAEALKKNKALA